MDKQKGKSKRSFAGKPQRVAQNLRTWRNVQKRRQRHMAKHPNDTMDPKSWVVCPTRITA